MIFYSLLLINRKLCRDEIFSEILTNIAKTKVGNSKLNNLTQKVAITWIIGTNISKSVFPVKDTKK